jgi:hypothetical protein
MPRNIQCSEGGSKQKRNGKNSETILLKISRPLRCNTEEQLEVTGHERMDWIKPDNYMDQCLGLSNRLFF